MTTARNASDAEELDEARRIAQLAAAAGVELRATGGVGIALVSPSARRPPLERSYGDIDFVGRSEQAHELGRFFGQLGYTPEEEFNLLHGQRRLFFRDPEGRWEADVFLDRIEGCHTLELRDRLQVTDLALAPADLLLSKLQIVQTNEKDFKDALALLADHEVTDDDSGINRERFADVCCSDWGWWRTVTMVGRTVDEATARYAEAPDVRDRLMEASARMRELLDGLESAPKSRRWKLRAKVGDRKRWYELPEDVEH